MNLLKLSFEKAFAIKVLALAAITVLTTLFDSRPVLAESPHVVKFPACTVIDTSAGPAITCTGGKFAGLGNEPVQVFLEAALACETRSGANQPGGHLQSDTVTITPHNGQISLTQPLTTNAATCPPGLNPVVGMTVDIVFQNESGVEFFRVPVPVS